jgi:hypothetical protein
MRCPALPAGNISLENIGKFGDPAVCGAIEIAPWHDKHKTPGVIVADTAGATTTARQ